MRKIYAFGDTETTGTTDLEQILDYAAVFVNKGEVLKSVNKEIIVKNNVIPHAKALLVNNINPFSKEWKEKAVSENKAVNLFIENFQEYKNDSVLAIFYNAPFDIRMIEAMFVRNGKNVHKVMPVVFDLYLLAKHLIDKGLLKTVDGPYGMSGKLGDVYKGLGFSTANMNAHNALGDTIVLPAIADKLYLLFAGKQMSDIDIDPSTFQENDIHSIIFLNPLTFTRSRPLQLVKKTILVVKNDIENKKLHIIDSEFMKLPANDPKKGIEVVDYAQIFDEDLMNATQFKVAQKYLSDYTQALKELASKIEISHDHSIDLPGFKAIEELCEKLNTKLDLESLTDQEKEILDQAEELSYAKYNKGWSFDLYGSEYKDRFKILFAKNNIKVGVDPIEGTFKVLENDLEVARGTKTQISSYLTEKNIVEAKSDEAKAIANSLGKIKVLKNEKALPEIISHFNLEKADVFNGANKFHKEILTDLLSFYKTQYPDSFKDIKIPTFKLDLSSFKKKV